jgi:demethoxyubiquinone hydroxylase (CLK1/Coq7/Cat5 family)
MSISENKILNVHPINESKKQVRGALLHILWRGAAFLEGAFCSDEDIIKIWGKNKVL